MQHDNPLTFVYATKRIRTQKNVHGGVGEQGIQKI